LLIPDLVPILQENQVKARNALQCISDELMTSERQNR